MVITQIPSPNHSDRRGSEIGAVVIHYDASPTSSGAIKWMCTMSSGVSAHFHVGRDGKVVQMVPLDRSAWHAGVGTLHLPGGKVTNNANIHSIGIELGNLGLLLEARDAGYSYLTGTSIRKYEGPAPIKAKMQWPGDVTMEVSGWWEPYPEVQIQALTDLLVWLGTNGESAAVRNLVAHRVERARRESAP